MLSSSFFRVAEVEDDEQSERSRNKNAPVLMREGRNCFKPSITEDITLKRSRLVIKCSARKCIRSKSALLILLWSFVLGLLNGILCNPDLYLRNFVSPFALAGYGFVAVVTLFYPLAGYLADIKYGRYKTVVRSLFCVVISITSLLGITGGIITIAATAASSKILSIMSMISWGVAFVTSYIGLVGFTANVIQFGMDQLHDSPGEDRTLFIHWYVWLYFLSIFIGQLAWNITVQIPYNNNIGESDLNAGNIVGICMLVMIPLAILVVLPVTLCLARHRKRWFLIEPGGVNPYKLVYRVTKFARQHKIPVRRSAFTYCEDEVPTGLDLGKEKYGGPFTTEQVEDVKVFYGILKVLFSFGTVFFLDFAASSVLPLYALHTTPSYDYYNFIDYNSTVAGYEIMTLYNGTQGEHILFNSNLLSPLLIVVCIPVYLCLLRPFISHCVPGMLKRMGLGMLLVVLSLVATFSMDIAAHSDPQTCVFKINITDDNMFLFLPYQAVQESSFLLIVPLTLSALSHMLIYTAVFEFICSQSPHSMKGLLIGLLYAIKGLYQLLATLLTVPIIGLASSGHSFFPISCGFDYYLVNVVLGVIAVLVYVWVAKRYRYRERDEPYNIHRYAEEYYSNLLEEPKYV